ncbi:MAG: hypothetical protein H0X01_02695 [Nitrospira sp.]|nr:hypothetical protein [Nitrospira sp.]
MTRLWRNHSLSIVLFGFGAVTLGVAIPLREGTWFDVFTGIEGEPSTAGKNITS